MRTAAVVVLAVVMLSGCSETEKSPTPTPTPVSRYNTDPRKGEVEVDRHCGFWSCQETTMRCVGPTLILTGADGSIARVPNAEECKP
jgi:uncharacterized protein YceK